MSQLARVIEHLRGVLLRPHGAGTDGDLLERYVVARDAAAFETLVRLHGPMVWGVCRRVLGHAHDAEDAFQAVFLVLARRAASVWPRERVGAWLYGVARRTALGLRRSMARRRQKERDAAALPRPVGGDDAFAELRPVLDEEVGRLPERYRAALVLCDLEGKTRKEAAEQLGWPEGTVASRQARARALLARRLARRGMTPGGLAALLAGEASAAPPAGLVAAAVQAAGWRTVSRAAAASVLSAEAVAIAEGVLRAMFIVKLKWVAVLLLAGVVCAGAAVSAHVLGTQPTGVGQPNDPARQAPAREAGAEQGKKGDKKPSEPPADSPKIQALLKERLAILKEQVAVLQKRFEQGVVTAEVLLRARRRACQAELELCATDRERVEVLQRLLALAKETEARTAQLVKTGAASQSILLEARADRLEVEIALERARLRLGAAGK